MFQYTLTLVLLSTILISGCGDKDSEEEVPTFTEDAGTSTPSEVIDAGLSEPTLPLWTPPSLLFRRNALRLQSFPLYNTGENGTLHLLTANFKDFGWGVYGSDCPTYLEPNNSCSILMGPNGVSSPDTVFEVTFESGTNAEPGVVITNVGFE